MDLFSKRLLVVSGKGGVGKTVVSSALALLAARRGKKVLLVKVDDQGRTSQLFGTPPLTDQVAELRTGVSAVNVDPRTVVLDYLARHLRIRTIARHIVDSRLFDAWFRVSPAIPEMISLGQVETFVEEKSWWRSTPVWDLVVFDAPATGHGLGLLRLPEQAAKLLIGPMRRNALSVAALLANPVLTSLLLVTIPEEMPVSEAIHFHAEATASTKVPLTAVILNGAFPERVPAAAMDQLPGALSGAAGQAALATLLGAGAPPALGRDALIRAAAWGRTRAELTARYRGELAARIPLPLVELPHVFSEQFGFAQLEQIASALDVALAGARLTAPAVSAESA